MSKPISLSDEELTIVMNICAPLQPQERSQLLAKLAEHLRGAPGIGPGALHRLVRELLRPIWRPPVVKNDPPSYTRRNVGEPIA
jgi:hypothetical protein